MTHLTLNNIVIELYKKLNYLEEPGSDIIAEINEIIASNELEDSENIPLWLLDFLYSIIKGNTVEKNYFPTEEILNNKGDIINFLAELADIIEMNYENYGEGITMEFKPLNLQAFICMEGGPGVCFYQIKLKKE